MSKLSGSSVLLEWNDDGGHSVTSYIIEYKEVDSLYWQKAGSVDGFTRNYTLQGLRENRDYIFRIYSINEFGQSVPIEMDLPLRPSNKYAGSSLRRSNLDKNVKTMKT